MKKYFSIFKLSLMSSLQYILDIVFGFIIYIIIIYIFLNLWQYMYEDPSSIINGYTMNQMVWYIILTEIIWSASSSRKLCKKISKDVTSGNIAYNLNKPYSYIGFSLTTHMSEAIIRLLMYGIVGITMGLIFLGPIPNYNPLFIPIVFLSAILAIIIDALLVIAIGLISFWVEDSNPLYWLYSKAILILGTMFPIEFFPKFLQTILKYTPVFVTMYGPAKLLVDFNLKNSAIILSAQIIYVAIASLICTFIYRKGSEKLNVNGG